MHTLGLDQSYSCTFILEYSCTLRSASLASDTILRNQFTDGSMTDRERSTSYFEAAKSIDLFHSKMCEMKTTFNGGQPQNIKNLISQQSLIGFSRTFKPKLRVPNKMLEIRTTSNIFVNEGNLKYYKNQTRSSI